MKIFRKTLKMIKKNNKNKNKNKNIHVIFKV